MEIQSEFDKEEDKASQNEAEADIYARPVEVQEKTATDEESGIAKN